MKHSLPELPFAKNALEPVMSAETLEYHHGKHHRAYVNKLNELVVGTEYESLPLEQIVLRAPAGTLFNNAAQAWNHDFFWNSLTPASRAREPEGSLRSWLERDFGSIDDFRKRFALAAAGQFGSGWAWLAHDPKNHRLSIVTTPNAENPMRQGLIPLLVVDVWEHAYYIDYRNERPRYLESLWKILNWEAASRRLSSESITSAA